MTNRRELLQFGAAAAAGSLVRPAGAAAPALSIRKVVYDERFAAGERFARRLERRGHNVYATRGDITAFWYGDLHPMWREGPAAVAGLTAQGALFCLERLGWDHGLRVVFRAEHVPLDSGGVLHRLEGPAAMLRASASLADARDAWGARVADLIALCPREADSGSTAHSTCRQISADGMRPAEPLYSWIIAPVARGRRARAPLGGDWA